MSQALHPNEDITVGTWTGPDGARWETIARETPDDTKFISVDSPSNESLEVRCQRGIDARSSRELSIRFRARRSGTSGSATIQAKLKEGSTVIATGPVETLTEDFQTFELTPTQDEINSIVDHENLRIELEADSAS